MTHNLSFLKCTAIIINLVCLASSALAQTQPILWSALRPADQAASKALPGMATSQTQGETLAWRDEGQLVELTGFVLPIDLDSDLVYEFMLVPSAGACSHTAPPPPNQLVRVVPEEPFRISKAYEPVTIVGSLRPGLDKAQLFILDGVRVLDFGYSMSRAEVTKVTKVLDPDLRASSPSLSR
jgi:hypothetical protein